jgi:DNA-binding winged helix-turn-helix (wHTH) protein
MATSGASRAVRAFAALLSLAIGVAGLPFALARFVGWPLPTTLPTMSEVMRSLGGSSVPDSFLVNALAVICWLAWAYLILCVVAELAAWTRGRAAIAIPLGGFVQPLVRQLVLTALLVGGSVRAAPLTSLVDATPTVLVRADFASELPVASAIPMTSTSRSQVELPTCVVRPRDSLWKLAEQHLGDGLRWRELWELNQGRTQPDGRQFTSPGLIRPGWILSFPADATGMAVVESAPVETGATPVFVSPPQDVPSPPAVAPEPLPVVPTTESKSDETQPPNNQHAAEITEADSTESGPDGEATVSPAPVVGATLMAVGVVAVVNRLRRRQQRERRRGHTIPIPAGDAARAERMLRTAAAASPANRVDAALRVLASRLASAGNAIPRIIAIGVDGDEIEILLEDPAAVGAPFVDSGSCRSWTLPEAVDTASLHAEALTRGSPAPALVTAGYVDGRHVMIDLEASSATAVTGSRSDIVRCLRSMALELATSVWSDDVRIVVVGNKIPQGIASLERVEVAETVTDAVKSIADGVSVTAETLRRQGYESTLDARIAQPSEAWTPIIVLIDPDVDAADRNALLTLASESPGLSIVVGSEEPLPLDREMKCEPDTVHLVPAGLILQPAGLSEEMMSATDELVSLALSDEPGPALDDVVDLRLDEPTSSLEQALMILRAESLMSSDSDRVLVRVLGPVEIEGGERPVDRRMARELTVYLALHPRGVAESQIKAALWPEDIPSQGAFNQCVSRARRALGVASDGSQHLPFVADATYRRGAHVVTDWELLETAWIQARRDRSEVAIEAVRSALTLVRGLPFEGSRGFEWAYEEGLPQRMSAVIDECVALTLENTSVRSA